MIETYLAQTAEESGRLELALERYRAVPDGERGWVAKLRAAAIAGQARTRRRGARVSRRAAGGHARTAGPGAAGYRAALRDAGDNQAAYAILSSALDKYDDDPDLLYDVAMVAEKLDRLDVVEAKLMRLVELRPSNAQALNALGYTLVDRTTARRRGTRADRARAGALARRSVHPRQRRLGAITGWARSTKRRSTCGARWSSAPTRRLPRTWAKCCGRRGDRARAQDLWQSQLQNAPDNAVLLETVRRLTR